MTAGWAQKRVALAPGATYPADTSCVLARAVVYRGCAVPVARAVLPANTPGAWHPHGVRLPRQVRAAPGTGGRWSS